MRNQRHSPVFFSRILLLFRKCRAVENDFSTVEGDDISDWHAISLHRMTAVRVEIRAAVYIHSRKNTLEVENQLKKVPARGKQRERREGLEGGERGTNSGRLFRPSTENDFHRSGSLVLSEAWCKVPLP